MARQRPRPEWSIGDDRCVRLSGDWGLIAQSADRRRLERELAALEAPLELGWDMRAIDALDSGGALLLWRLWGRQLPHTLQCRDDQRHWFRRLRNAPAIDADVQAPALMRPLLALGATLTSAGHTAFGIFALVGQLLLDFGYALRHPRLIPWREISATIYRTGVSSMLLLGVVGFLIGVVMTIQIGLEIERFGADQMIIGLLGIAVLRELGAVVTALILAGRSGASITAGIGAMHITEEFNALRSFGVSPTLRLVLPRVIGMGIAVPLLVLWADFWAIVGGALSTQSVLGISETLFFQQLPVVVAPVNLWIGLGKGMLFGLTIAVVASYYGLITDANAESLSTHTTTSVVTSLSLILLLDALSGALLTNVGLF